MTTMVEWVETREGQKWLGRIGHGLYIGIVREPSGVGWIVSFLDEATTQRFATLHAAQMSGVQLAREALTECLMALDKPGY